MIKYTFWQTPDFVASFRVVDGDKFVEVETGGNSLSISLTEFTVSYGFNPRLYAADAQYESHKDNQTIALILPQYTSAKAA
jgi:hypothetical protein